MEVILMERIGRLGKLGEVVKVKDGYARNFLIPRKKALRANEQNKAFFERERARIEAHNNDLKDKAEATAKKLDGYELTLIRQAGEDGRLYGSVTSKDIVDALNEKGFAVEKSQAIMQGAIKLIGESQVRFHLYAEVDADITVTIARTEAEAEAARLKKSKKEAKAEEKVEAAAGEAALEVATSEDAEEKPAKKKTAKKKAAAEE